MRKLPNWNMNLWKFIDENKAKGFSWGSWDCCTATDSAIKAMTGESLIPKELHWRCETSAKKAIKNYGGNLLKALLKACKLKNIEEIALGFMAVGDIAIFKGEYGYVVAVCDGNILLGVCDDGWQPKPMSSAVKAWRIPN